MDQPFETRLSDPLAICGSGSIILAADSQPDLLPWLKQPKTKKFMGKQDQLAVIAAGLAAQRAGLSDEDLRIKTGIYLCVGYIPFEQHEIEKIARNSSRNGEFSMDLFSTKGFEEVSPLLTFRCLPNMPIFHVSLNLNIHGPYFITYPGPGQFYLALEQACLAIESGEVQYALVGGVADQNNFLVQHHYDRTTLKTGGRASLPAKQKPTPDAAAFICLAKENGKSSRLLEMKLRYQATPPADFYEAWDGKNVSEYLGAASLPVLVDRHRTSGKVRHTVRSIDGFEAETLWEL